MILLVLIIASNFLGLWSIDAQVLNQLTVYLIVSVAVSYFIYLFFFAGLNKKEKEFFENCNSSDNFIPKPTNKVITPPRL